MPVTYVNRPPCAAISAVNKFISHPTQINPKTKIYTSNNHAVLDVISRGGGSKYHSTWWEMHA